MEKRKIRFFISLIFFYPIFLLCLSNSNFMQKKESKTNWHFNISLFKSCLRIVAGVTIIRGQFVEAGVLIIIAEILGIAEELF